MSTAPTPEPVEGAGRASKRQGRGRQPRKQAKAATPARDAAVAGAFNGWLLAQDILASWAKTLRLALLLGLVLAIIVAAIVLVVVSGGDVGALIKGLASGVVGTVGVVLVRWNWRRRQQRRLILASPSASVRHLQPA